jgi:hypothetical protein
MDAGHALTSGFSGSAVCYCNVQKDRLCISNGAWPIKAEAEYDTGI